MAVRDHGVAIQFGDAAITGAASPSILRIAGREVLVRTRGRSSHGGKRADVRVMYPA